MDDKLSKLRTRTHICECECMYASASACMRVRVHVCECECMYASVRVCTSVYVCVPVQVSQSAGGNGYQVKFNCRAVHRDKTVRVI